MARMGRRNHTQLSKVPRCLVLVTAWIAIFLPSLAPAEARAQPFLPPPGRVFSGEVGPIGPWLAATGSRPAVVQVFAAWGQYLPAIFQSATALHARLMIHITTASGDREAITPGAIARGAGDGWLMALGRAASTSGTVTYVRLMAEMDAYWNPYSAYNANGRPRNRDHSTAAYRAAWKRVTLILRGGSRAAIDAELRRLHQPPLAGSGDLPRPQIAMLWVPQVAGAPDIPGNSPRAYWPGRRWVDWVGTDFYSRYPNFAGLNAFYRAFGRLPFVFGEYALWGRDDPGWVRRLFAWIGTHRRTRMLIYNQGMQTGGPFRLSHYPRAAAALRRELRSPRFSG